MRSGRIVVAAGVVCLLAAAAVAAALVLMPPRQTAEVAVPPDGAAPQQVVSAYLDAVDAHDCDTAEALTADGFGSWCGNVDSLTQIEVDPPHREPGVGDLNTYVAVSFDLDWRVFHGDIAMPEGGWAWGYSLVRESRDGPWRIVDQGVG